mmetsp:Transcript_32524/g.64360  ORF Transcript_32524/g.64360 Transcript_32524/m.64360 type:complete len:237 (+) Transcript_32524:898-1608(+)
MSSSKNHRSSQGPVHVVLQDDRAGQLGAKAAVDGGPALPLRGPRPMRVAGDVKNPHLERRLRYLEREGQGHWPPRRWPCHQGPVPHRDDIRVGRKQHHRTAPCVDRPGPERGGRVYLRPWCIAVRGVRNGHPGAERPARGAHREHLGPRGDPRVAQAPSGVPEPPAEVGGDNGGGRRLRQAGRGGCLPARRPPIPEQQGGQEGGGEDQGRGRRHKRRRASQVLPFQHRKGKERDLR